MTNPATNMNLIERLFIKSHHRWEEYRHPKKKRTKLQSKNFRPNNQVRRYISNEIEPIVLKYIKSLLVELSFERPVSIDFNWDCDWEVNIIKNTTINSKHQEFDSDIAMCSGQGVWKMSIGGIDIPYELKTEWNIPKEYISITLTKPKLERLMRGEYVPNVPGHVLIYLPMPKKKVDNSIIDQVRNTVEMFMMRENQNSNSIGLSKKESEEAEEFEPPLFTPEYHEMETDMKIAISALGWKWKNIDKDKMDKCIRGALNKGEKVEDCLRKYLKKE